MKTATERLLEKASFNKEGCLIWNGATRKGYGLIWYRGKLVSAHRLAWLLSKGEIPLGMQVLHKCDNPQCVNLKHLFLGSQRDNIQDAISKGRYNASEYGKHPNPFKGWTWKLINNKRVWCLACLGGAK